MFSQNSEEHYILEICGETGRFLDIGAWDGETFSNTRALALKGWTGVLVEPSSVPFGKLERLYNGTPGIALVNAAVCEISGEVELWESSDAVSTTLDSHYRKWNKMAEFTGRRMVRAVTVAELMAQHGAFDFVNIDTEGTSVDIFHQLDLRNMKPRCICVEHDGHIDEIDALAGQFGYVTAHQNGENVILECGQ